MQHSAPGQIDSGDDSNPSAMAPYEDIDYVAKAKAMAVMWKPLIGAPLATSAVAIAASYFIAPTFLSTTTFLPPQQQQQTTAASALSSLGALASLSGGAIKTPGDQFVAFMQSVTVEDRIIERFKLMSVYDVKFRQDARLDLNKHVRISLGKKDGLISVAVEDRDPQRAADMANRYVDELRVLCANLAVTEAQQRRVFFENQWQLAKSQLIKAQLALEQSGFNASALKAEPKAAAEAYAHLRADLSTAEIKLRALRTSRADGAPEVQQMGSIVQSLRDRLAQLESSESQAAKSADYVGNFREFKYQETMFELMSKQYELARVDESREGALIQVVDPATPAEKKFSPRRSFFALGGFIVGLLLAMGWVTHKTKRVVQTRPR